MQEGHATEPSADRRRSRARPACEAVRGRGRLTSQLLHVRRVLEDADEHHLSSRMLHERLLTVLPDTPISTVYRALARLERIGVIPFPPDGE